MKKNIATLLETEMDRRDFLRHVGIALLAVFGVSALLRNISQLGSSSSNKNISEYGSSPYGG